MKESRRIVLLLVVVQEEEGYVRFLPLDHHAANSYEPTLSTQNIALGLLSAHLDPLELVIRNTCLGSRFRCWYPLIDLFFCFFGNPRRTNPESETIRGLLK